MPSVEYEEALKAVGRRITEARERRGWSQDVLAERIGTTQGAITNWETGKRVPRPEPLLKLAKELQVTPAWIMEPLYGTPDLKDPTTAEKVRDLRRRLDEAFNELLRDAGDA